ncbi:MULTISPECIES: hypothetical protein [unclassified Nostoc]|uniref:hypothetical protein n=1 Tax=unclassified Nostoc TaxID=2593658 RepID=UPI001689BA9D|nr:MULTISPECIES: hypothetical protein [unclassified Nostoc]MBD2469277.1 hypothetical protein [Nostoc sp. FACHB-145]
MNRIICIGLIALPAYLYNAELSLASSGNLLTVNTPMSISTAFISHSHSINTQPNLAPWLISSREDQTGDCLRDGSCRS